MRIVTALTTALVLLGFAGAAAAMCPGMEKPAADTTAETPILLPERVGS